MKLFFVCSFLIIFSCSKLEVSRAPSVSNVVDKIGIEATLTNQSLLRHQQVLPSELDDLLFSLSRKIQSICSDCRVSTYQGPSYETEYKISFPDGYQMYLQRDHRVIEITADPIPFEDLIRHSRKVSDYLLLAGEQIGLFPAKNTGGGHIHLDFASLFKNDASLLRDFLVDAYNNEFMFQSIFGGQAQNAPTIGQLPLESRRNFFKLIQDFDQGGMNIIELVNRLESEVYHHTFAEGFSPTQKFQAINLTHVFNKNGTIEFRNVRPYQNGDFIQSFAKAIIGRRDFLLKEREGGRIVVPKEKINTYSIREKLSRAEKYLIESGQNPFKYYASLPSIYFDEVQKRIPSDQFANFITDWIRYTAFDDLPRAEKILSRQVLNQLSDDQLKEVMVMLVRKFRSQENYQSIKGQLNNYMGRLGTTINELEFIATLRIYQSRNCFELIPAMLR